jgi:hypothetical protein
LATSAFIATQLGAAAAALGWITAEWLRGGKPSALGAISGAVAGLVAITPAAGFVGPMAALTIGAAAGVVCYFMVTVVKARFGYDDSLDAFGVHGAGGMLGALLTGVFASSAINPIFHDASGGVLASGWLEGNARQMLRQAAGVAVACVLAAVGTLLILKLVDATLGLRVSEEHEEQGLDVSQHGEEGYAWEPAVARAPAPTVSATPLRLSVRRRTRTTPVPPQKENSRVRPPARRRRRSATPGIVRRTAGRRPGSAHPAARRLSRRLPTRVVQREFQPETQWIGPSPLHWI